MEKLHNKIRSPHHKRIATLLPEGKGNKSNTDNKELDYLPDGSHISPHKILLRKSSDATTTIREAQVRF